MDHQEAIDTETVCGAIMTVTVKLKREPTEQDLDILTSAYVASITSGLTQREAIKRVYATVLQLKTPELCIFGPIWFKGQFYLDAKPDDFSDSDSYQTMLLAVEHANLHYALGDVETDLDTFVAVSGTAYQIVDNDVVVAEYSTVQAAPNVFRRYHVYKSLSSNYGSKQLVKLMMRQRAVMGLQ